MIDEWLAWARLSKLAPFVKLARSIRNHRVGIDSALVHGLSNARVEAANAKLRLLTRLAFGFHSHALDRARDASSRRPLSATSKARLAHGHVRRAQKNGLPRFRLRGPFTTLGISASIRAPFSRT